jgi:uncharacterized membrane protein
MASAANVARARLRRVIAAHLGSRDVARVIYGSVIGLALVVALSEHPPTATETAVALLGTAVAVGLAEAYSDLIGGEARTQRAIRPRHLRAAAAEAGAVIFGAGFPALFFVLSALGAMDIDLAFTLSKWTGLGLLCLYGYLAGRVSGSTVGGALLHSAVVGAIGGALIALKSLLH